MIDALLIIILILLGLLLVAGTILLGIINGINKVLETYFDKMINRR